MENHEYPFLDEQVITGVDFLHGKVYPVIYLYEGCEEIASQPRPFEWDPQQWDTPIRKTWQ